jgi:succinyl-diaminopimelate desuccinylase
MTVDPISLTQKLLSLNTINPPGDERECAYYLGSLLEGAGFEARFYEFAEKRTTLIAWLPGSGDKLPICFTGHLDTVPLGANPWSRDPFAGERDGDKLYGRGSSDMKSGVAAITLMALRLAHFHERKAGIKLIFTAGEETTCEGALHIAGLGGVIGEAGALVAGEPTSNAPWVAHKGCVRFMLKTQGVAAHASMPEKGVNAIYKAAEIIKKLEKFEFGTPPHPLLGAPTLTVSTIAGGTAINVVPEEALIGVDIRTLPGQDENDVRRKLEAELGPDVIIQRLNGAPSVATDPGHPWVQEVFEVMEGLSNKRPVPAGATYFTDASVLTPALGDPPTLIMGPGEPEMAHRTDEFCYVSKIGIATEAYFAIARRWLER